MFTVKSKDINGKEKLVNILPLWELKDYYMGQNCNCYAVCQSECCCNDVDWTPREVYENRWKIYRLREVVKRDLFNEKSAQFKECAYIEYLENLLEETEL
jgi:hypothetical protein